MRPGRCTVSADTALLIVSHYWKRHRVTGLYLREAANRLHLIALTDNLCRVMGSHRSLCQMYELFVQASGRNMIHVDIPTVKLHLF